MSADQNPSGNPAVASGEGGKDSVSYDSFQKVLAEKKAEQEKRRQLEAQLAEKEQAALAEQGKWKELAEKAQADLKVEREKTTKVVKTFGQELFTKEAKQVALQLGVNQSALDDLIKVGDWSGIEIGEDLKLDQDKIKESILKLQKDKPYFFTKSASAPRDVNLSSGGVSGKSVDQMSREEIAAALKALG